MTKEELEKEAIEYAQKLGVKDFIAKPKEIVAYFGYLAGAEPREKRIEELETRCNKLFFQVNEKIAKVDELEAKNKELQEKLDKIFRYLAFDVPPELMNEVTDEIYRML